MKWTDSLFVDNARYYAMVLESQWKDGIETAKLLADLFKEKGMKKCSVLDIPCGIGRVSVPLARLGYTVSGVDLSPYFIRVAKKKSRQFRVSKGATFAVGNMKDVGSLFPKGQFDVAVNVYSSIGFGSEADDLEFFKGLRQVVRKGGLLVISLLTNRDFVISHFSGKRNWYETDRLVILQKDELDVLHSRVRSEWRFLRKHGRSLRYATESSVDSRLYSPHELVRMLEAAGWKTTAIYDSLGSRRPYSPDNPHITLIAEAR